MDKHSKKRIFESMEEIVGKAHLGHLNGVGNIETKVIVAQKRIKLPDNIMVFQTFASLAALKLSTGALRVLMLFFSVSGYENFVSMDIKTIAEKLKIGDKHIIIILNELVKANIIIKTKYSHDRRRNEYFINPLAAWRGNSYARKKKIQLVEKNKMQLGLFDDGSAGQPASRQPSKELI